MSTLHDGVRQAMAWLHGWTGLLLGWVLFVMCLAGTLSVFKPEIGRWMRPESVAVVDQVQAVDHAVAWLKANAAGSDAWYLTAPTERMNTVEAYYTQGNPDYLYRALDPTTGAPVPRETIGGEFFYRLHFELELPYPWGRLLASLAGMVMLVAIVTGVIAHRRIFRDFFTFRPRKGQRSWLDGHNALGVLSLPFHLMITFTGIVTLASLSMPWAVTANYGANLEQMEREFGPGAVEREATGHKVPLAPVAPMLEEARRRFGGRGLGGISIIHPGDAAAVVSVHPSDAGQFAQHDGEISFDGTTGRVLRYWSERRPALQTYNIVYGLHLARFASSLLRWLYFVGGAMLTLAVASGLVLWIVKRREKAPLGVANRLVERANAGVLAGMPIGCAAFLCANRLLPLGIAGRAESETHAALWAAGAAIAAGLALPPARAWPLLLGLLAAGLLALPWLGEGAGARMADAAARGDTVLIATDIVLTVLGAAALWLAIATTGGRRPAPRRRTERAAA